MVPRFIALALICTLLAPPYIAAQAKPDEEAKRMAKLKREVNKAFEKNARLSVELRDGRKLQGNVSELAPDAFVLVSDGSSSRLAYGDLVRVKRHGTAARKRALVAAGMVAGLFGLILAAGTQLE